MPAANNPPVAPSNDGPASQLLPSPSWRSSKQPALGSAAVRPLTAGTPRKSIDNEYGVQTSNNSDLTIIPNPVEKSSNINGDPSLVVAPVRFKSSPPSSLDPKSFTTAQELRQILDSYGMLYPAHATTSQLQECLTMLVQHPARVERRKVDQLPPGWSIDKVPTSGRVYYKNHIEKSTTWTDPRIVNLASSLDFRGDNVLPPRNLSNSANHVDPYRGDSFYERFSNDPPASKAPQPTTASRQYPQKVAPRNALADFSDFFSVSGLHTSTYAIC